MSSPACSVSCRRLANPAQHSCSTAANAMRTATLSTMFEPALPKRGDDRLLHPEAPWETLLGLRVPPYAARRRFACRLSVLSGRGRERRVPAPWHSQNIAHRVACGPDRAAASLADARPQDRTSPGASWTWSTSLSSTSTVIGLDDNSFQVSKSPTTFDVTVRTMISCSVSSIVRPTSKFWQMTSRTLECGLLRTKQLMV